MSLRETVSSYGYDDDTFRLLEISVDFLVRYFDHTPAKASELMIEFLKIHSEAYDEDDLHHDSSYRIAAMAHFLVAWGGAREDLGGWLIDQGHISPPPEALEYFREKYFSK